MQNVKGGVKMDKNYMQYIIADRKSTMRKAAEMLGCTYSTLTRRMSPADNGSHLSIEDCQKLAEFYKMTDKEILKAFFERD